MLESPAQENQIEELEKKIRELEIENEALAQETKAIYDKLELSPTQIAAFFEDGSHLSEEKRLELEKTHQELQARLELNLAFVPDLKKTKKNFQSLNLPPHAIFCK